MVIEKDQIISTQFTIQLKSLISIRRNIKIHFTGKTPDGFSTSATIPIYVWVEGPLELGRIPQEVFLINPLQQTEFRLDLKNQTQEKLEIFLSCSESWIHLANENPMIFDKKGTDMLKVLIHPFFLKPGLYSTKLTLSDQSKNGEDTYIEIPIKIDVKPLSFWKKLLWLLRFPLEKIRLKRVR